MPDFNLPIGFRCSCVAALWRDKVQMAELPGAVGVPEDHKRAESWRGHIRRPEGQLLLIEQLTLGPLSRGQHGTLQNAEMQSAVFKRKAVEHHLLNLERTGFVVL